MNMCTACVVGGTYPNTFNRESYPYAQYIHVVVSLYT